MFPSQFWILYAIALLLDAVGFHNFVWFMSVGYGFAVAGIGITDLFLFHQTLGLAGIITCLLLVVYGVRLGGFLLLRSLKNKSYKTKMNTVKGSAKPIPLLVRIMMWLCMGLLYVCQTSPVLYRGVNHSVVNAGSWIGAIIMAAGIIIESLADQQKSAAKKVNPQKWADQGLYQIVRCPNYFGEILFWTGVFVTGFGAVQQVQWVIAILGYILILYIMFAGARRMELRHEKSYGDDPQFRHYAEKTPLILPLVPLYSLKKATWLKG